MRALVLTSLAVLVATACQSTPPPTQAVQPSGATSAPGVVAPAVAVLAHAISVPADHRYVSVSDGQTGRILLVDLAKGSSTEIVAARGSPGRPTA